MVDKDGYNYDEFLGDLSRQKYEDCEPKYSTTQEQLDAVKDSHEIKDSPEIRENNLNQCEDSNDSPLCSDSVVIHPKDDEANYNEAYGKSLTNRNKDTEELKIAIYNVLELAREQTKTYFKECVEAERIIAESSIKIVEDFLVSYRDSNIGLALSEKKV